MTKKNANKDQGEKDQTITPEKAKKITQKKTPKNDIFYRRFSSYRTTTPKINFLSPEHGLTHLDDSSDEEMFTESYQEENYQENHDKIPVDSSQANNQSSCNESSCNESLLIDDLNLIPFQKQMKLGLSCLYGEHVNRDYYAYKKQLRCRNKMPDIEDITAKSDKIKSILRVYGINPEEFPEIDDEAFIYSIYLNLSNSNVYIPTPENSHRVHKREIDEFILKIKEVSDEVNYYKLTQYAMLCFSRLGKQQKSSFAAEYYFKNCTIFNGDNCESLLLKTTTKTTNKAITKEKINGSSPALDKILSPSSPDNKLQNESEHIFYEVVKIYFIINLLFTANNHNVFKSGFIDADVADSHIMNYTREPQQATRQNKKADGNSEETKSENTEKAIKLMLSERLEAEKKEAHEAVTKNKISQLLNILFAMNIMSVEKNKPYDSSRRENYFTTLYKKLQSNIANLAYPAEPASENNKKEPYKDEVDPDKEMNDAFIFFNNLLYKPDGEYFYPLLNFIFHLDAINGYQALMSILRIHLTNKEGKVSECDSLSFHRGTLDSKLTLYVADYPNLLAYMRLNNRSQKRTARNKPNLYIDDSRRYSFAVCPEHEVLVNSQLTKEGSLVDKVANLERGSISSTYKNIIIELHSIMNEIFNNEKEQVVALCTALRCIRNSSIQEIRKLKIPENDIAYLTSFTFLIFGLEVIRNPSTIIHSEILLFLGEAGYFNCIKSENAEGENSESENIESKCDDGKSNEDDMSLGGFLLKYFPMAPKGATATGRRATEEYYSRLAIPAKYKHSYPGNKAAGKDAITSFYKRCADIDEKFSDFIREPSDGHDVLLKTKYPILFDYAHKNKLTINRSIDYPANLDCSSSSS